MRRNTLILIFLWALFVVLNEQKPDGICPPQIGDYYETPELYRSVKRYCTYYSSPEDWHKRVSNNQINGVRQRITTLERFNRGRAR